MRMHNQRKFLGQSREYYRGRGSNLMRTFVISLLFCSCVSAWGQAYPLKLSPNHRYLVDQNNVPFLDDWGLSAVNDGQHQRLGSD